MKFVINLQSREQISPPSHSSSHSMTPSPHSGAASFKSSESNESVSNVELGPLSTIVLFVATIVSGTTSG